MESDVERIPAFFASWVAEHGGAGPTGEVAAWLASGGLAPGGFDEIVDRHGVAREPWFRAQTLDLILEYASQRLEAGAPTIDDLVDLQLLKRALRVSEGDLLRIRAPRVTALVQRAIDRVFEGGYSGIDEERQLAGVQAAFDLSYDDFLHLGQPSFERAMTGLRTGLLLAGSRVEGEDVERRHRNAVEATYFLATMDPRHSARGRELAR